MFEEDLQPITCPVAPRFCCRASVCFFEPKWNLRNSVLRAEDFMLKGELFFVKVFSKLISFGVETIS